MQRCRHAVTAFGWYQLPTIGMLLSVVKLAYEQGGGGRSGLGGVQPPGTRHPPTPTHPTL